MEKFNTPTKRGREYASRSCRTVTHFILALLFVGACSTARTTPIEPITVEGVVTARGNEPLVRYVLETSDRNFYALRIPEGDRTTFQTPARLKVTGRVFVEDWDGRAFTHIHVMKWQRVD